MEQTLTEINGLNTPRKVNRPRTMRVKRFSPYLNYFGDGGKKFKSKIVKCLDNIKCFKFYLEKKDYKNSAKEIIRLFENLAKGEILNNYLQGPFSLDDDRQLVDVIELAIDKILEFVYAEEPHLKLVEHFNEYAAEFFGNDEKIPNPLVRLNTLDLEKTSSSPLKESTSKLNTRPLFPEPPSQEIEEDEINEE